MKSIIEKLNDGGPLITYTILVLLVIIIVLFVRAIIVKDADELKARSLIASIGWFALAWGYLGRTFGLIMSFDNVAAAGEITPRLLAGGLKMALVGPLVGLTTFLVARTLIIVLITREKKADATLD